MFWLDLETACFPPDHFSRYLSRAEDAWHCADGLRRAAGLASSDPMCRYPKQHGPGWLEEPAAGDSMHPAELRQHLPTKDGVDTSNSPPDANKCLAPGSFLC